MPKPPWITAGGVFLVVFGLVTAGVVAGIFLSGFTATLANAAQTRGIIAFLFTISTIAIVILTAIAMFWNPKEVGEQFKNAKDIVVILVGLLGPILGFYFGSTDGNRIGPFALGAAVFEPATVKPSGQVALGALLSGGTPPYIYSISLSSPDNAIPADKLATLLAVQNKLSEKGQISEILKIPADFKPATIRALITARDALGSSAQQDLTLSVAP